MEEPGVKGPIGLPIDKPGDKAPFSHPLMGSLKKCGEPGTLRIAVEFECDDCCKKALNAKIIEITDEFVLLAAWDDTFILVKTISAGKLVDKEIVKAIVIPLERVCSIEIGAVQIDP